MQNQDNSILPSSYKSNIIKILKLSITPNNEAVEIVFWLDEEIVSGTVQVERVNLPDPDEGRIEVDVEDLDVWGEDPGFLQYLDSDLGVFAGMPYSYYLAYDETGTGLGSDPTEYIHTTIYLKDLEIDNCTREARLEWDEYIIRDFNNYPDGDREELPYDYYQIYLNGDYQKTVPAGTTNAVIQVSDTGTNLFRVRAVEHDDLQDPGWYSFSNTVEQTVYWPELDEVVIENVSVTPGGDVEVSIGVVGDDFPEYLFFIERSRQKEGDYQEIAEITIDSTLYTFTDEQADGLDQDIWYYRVRAHLSDAGGHPCDEPAVVSGPVSTLWLSASPSEDDPSEIYFEFRRDPAANSYTLMQRLPGDTDFEDAAVTGPISPYRHDINDELGLFGFRLRGEHMGMEYYSNTVELYIEPEIKIPNAFRPGSEFSENRVFKPFFPDGFEYSIRIYNRNGLQVYSSGTSGAEQWDGDINGVPAPEGTYLYHIIYTAPFHDIPDGEKKGTVYLVR